MSNWIDIGILILIGLSTLFGLFTGFVKGAISIISWILAFFVASWFYADLAARFQGSLPSMMANTLAYSLIFFGIIAIGIIASLILTRVIFLSMTLTMLNSLLGGFFGFLRGAVFVTALTYIALLTPAPSYPIWQGSSLISYFVSLANTVNSLIPDSIKQQASQLSPQNLKNMNLNNLKSEAQQYIQSYTNRGSNPSQ
jgi:membrane protein required for colicin V production